MGNGARLRCKGLAAECRQWSDAIGDGRGAVAQAVLAGDWQELQASTSG